MALSEKRAARHSISKDTLSSLIFYSILGYVVGGRILFTLANLSAFRGNLLSIFSINIELFDPIGALVTALIVGFIHGQRQKLPVWSTLDALTPFFATLAIGLSLSHLAAGTSFGQPTSVPWGIELWNALRHPTQIYEFLAAVLIFGMIWIRKLDTPTGSDFLLFIALTAATRLFLEAFHGDSAVIFGGIRLVQVISWAVLAITLIASEAIRREEKIN